MNTHTYTIASAFSAIDWPTNLRLFFLYSEIASYAKVVKRLPVETCILVLNYFWSCATQLVMTDFVSTLYVFVCNVCNIKAIFLSGHLGHTWPTQHLSVP